MIGLLYFAEHLDAVHDTHCELLRATEFVREVFLKRLDDSLEQQISRELRPPFDQMLQEDQELNLLR